MSLRTRESVILDDAAAQSTFAEDPYIRERQARSILCLPLVSQGKLNGVLYLENNLARGVFAPARNAVLKLLASQAAICAGEYPSVPRSGGTRSEDSTPGRRQHHRDLHPIVRRKWTGQIVEANDAFLRMVGYDREDLVSGRLRWSGADAARMARPRCAGCGRTEDDRERPAVREGVFPEGRQPCARTDRRGEFAKAGPRASPSCSI